MRRYIRKTKRLARAAIHGTKSRDLEKELDQRDSILQELSPRIRKVVEDIVARLDDDLRRLSKH